MATNQQKLLGTQKPMTNQCTICQSIHKQPPNKDGARDCFSQRRFPKQYPPNGRKPEITITVDCNQFSHINGGTITFRSKRK